MTTPVSATLSHLAGGGVAGTRKIADDYTAQAVTATLIHHDRADRVTAGISHLLRLGITMRGANNAGFLAFALS
jgi:hypothetical protein